jgi:RNA polymerase sigma-70 factor (ECF subfamily)
MKSTSFVALALAGAVVSTTFLPLLAQAEDIDSMPPVVIKTLPESGDKTVAAGETVIQVTFSKEMANGSWSWSSAWNNSTPEVIGKPKYDADHKTCTLHVKLEPNKTYAYWLNSNNFHNFKDRQGHPSVPYLLVFQTRDN